MESALKLSDEAQITSSVTLFFIITSSISSDTGSASGIGSSIKKNLTSS